MITELWLLREWPYLRNFQCLEVEGMMFLQSQYTHVKRENDKKNRALLIKSVQEFFILVLKLFYVFKFKIK